MATAREQALKLLPPDAGFVLHSVEKWSSATGSRSLRYDPRAGQIIPLCALCGLGVKHGLAIVYRCFVTIRREKKKWKYVHRACLKPIKTAWKE